MNRLELFLTRWQRLSESEQATIQAEMTALLEEEESGQTDGPAWDWVFIPHTLIYDDTISGSDFLRKVQALALAQTNRDNGNRLS